MMNCDWKGNVEGMRTFEGDNEWWLGEGQFREIGKCSIANWENIEFLFFSLYIILI